MNRSSVQVEEEWFEEARKLTDPADRTAFIGKVSAGNLSVIERLEKLLAADKKASQIFADGAKALGTAVTETPCLEEPGDLIGRYKLLELLGEGGCGVVYKARQETPVRRDVALKIIKLGMDTREVVARFEAERQALALMDHPSIARIYDAGATQTGRPYFVMELVEGIKITEFCDQQKLSIRQRLGLFMRVCPAIQHAHQKGIIHRDLKPSNILINSRNGASDPKVIDFGIAKATQGRLAEMTVVTCHHQLIGTPGYMSPEQAELTNCDIDTRTDIYSLGVLLYELITGKTPFNSGPFPTDGINEIRRKILQLEPYAPSLCFRRMSEGDLGRAAEQRSCDPRRLGKQVARDLDSIILKCLEKDRSIRYQTVSDLASDLRRYLANEPVTAQPATASYRLHKFVRRNKLACATGVTLILAISLGTIFTWWEAIRARKAERQQEALREKAELQEAGARAQVYASAMLLAHESLKANAYQTVREILEENPSAGVGFDNSHRLFPGWEWRHLNYELGDESSAAWKEMWGNISALAISPDQKWVAGGCGKQAFLLDSASREIFARFDQESDVTCVALSMDSTLLAVGTVAGSVHVLSLPSGNRIRDFAVSNRLADEFPVRRKILTVRFSADGERLAFASSVTYSVIALKGETDAISYSLPEAWRTAISSDLRTAVRALAPDGIGFFHDGTNTIVPHVITSRYHFPGGIAFSPDNRFAAVPSDDGTIDIWSTNEPKLAQKLPGNIQPINPICWSHNGRLLATGGENECTTIWDWQAAKPIRRLHGHRRSVDAVAFSPDDSSIFSGSKDHTIRRWDLATIEQQPDEMALPIDSENSYLTAGGRFMYTQQPDGITIARTYPFPKIVDFIRCAGSVSSDGEWVLSPYWDDNRCDLYHWNGDRFVYHSQQRAIQKVRRRPVFSEDGTRVALLGLDGTFGVWQVAPWRGLAEWRGAEAHSYAMVFDPPGDRIFLVNETKGVFIGDIDSGHLEHLPNAPNQSGIAISPNNHFVAITADCSVMVWAFAPREQARLKITIPLHGIDPICLTFSPDGKRLIVGMSNGQIQIWDFERGLKVGVLEGHKHPVLDMRFAPQQALASISCDEIRLWRVSAPSADPPTQSLGDGRERPRTH